MARGREASEPLLDPRGLGRERRARGGQGLELVGRQPTVHRERAEPLGRRIREIGGDRVHQAREPGPVDPLQQRPPAEGVERPVGQHPPERRRGQVPARSIAAEREADRRVCGDLLGGQRGRVNHRGLHHLGDVVKGHARRERLTRARRLSVDPEQALPPLDRLDALAGPSSPTPPLDHRVGGVELAPVLQPEREVVVVVVGAGHQGRERRVAVVRQRERFEGVDVHRRTLERRETERQGHGR